MKYIQCDDIRWIADKDTFIAPLGMNNRFAGSKMAEGLYVKLWGVATYVEDSGDTNAIFMLDDGSGTPIKLRTYGPAPAMPMGLVAVCGVLTYDGETPVLYMTNTSLMGF